MFVCGERSEDGAGDLFRRATPCTLKPHARAAGPGVLDDLAAAVWVQAYDAAWLGRDWTTLERYLAPDIALMSPSFRTAIVGRDAVLAHLRAMMFGVRIHEYNATDLKGHSSGPVGVITYRWQLDWTVDHERRPLSGRDILVLCATSEGWQLMWRVQVRCMNDPALP
jgi:ketosteroid isomerase-like protein